MPEWIFLSLCILLSLVLMIFFLRPYVRRYQNSTPFLTPVSKNGERPVPFGVMQVKRLAEQMQINKEEQK